MVETCEKINSGEFDDDIINLFLKYDVDLMDYVSGNFKETQQIYVCLAENLLFDSNDLNILNELYNTLIYNKRSIRDMITAAQGQKSISTQRSNLPKLKFIKSITSPKSMIRQDSSLDSFTPGMNPILFENSKYSQKTNSKIAIIEEWGRLSTNLNETITSKYSSKGPLRNLTKVYSSNLLKDLAKLSSLDMKIPSKNLFKRSSTDLVKNPSNYSSLTVLRSKLKNVSTEFVLGNISKSSVKDSLRYSSSHLLSNPDNNIIKNSLKNMSIDVPRDSHRDSRKLSNKDSSKKSLNDLSSNSSKDSWKYLLTNPSNDRDSWRNVSSSTSYDPVKVSWKQISNRPLKYAEKDSWAISMKKSSNSY